MAQLGPSRRVDGESGVIRTSCTHVPDGEPCLTRDHSILRPRLDTVTARGLTSTQQDARFSGTKGSVVGNDFCSLRQRRTFSLGRLAYVLLPFINPADVCEWVSGVNDSRDSCVAVQPEFCMSHKSQPKAQYSGTRKSPRDPKSSKAKLLLKHARDEWVRVHSV